MTIRDTLAMARRQPFAAVALVLVTVSALLSAASGRIAYVATNRLDEVVQDGDAQRCVNAWEARTQLRAAIPIPTEAIITIATAADPADVAALREDVDRRIRETFPNPDCDLDAARAELAD